MAKTITADQVIAFIEANRSDAVDQFRGYDKISDGILRAVEWAKEQLQEAEPKRKPVKRKAK